jgi:hypothetical protein
MIVTMKNVKRQSIEDESYNEECEEEVNEESLESMEMNIQCKVGKMNHTMIRESKC